MEPNQNSPTPRPERTSKELIDQARAALLEQSVVLMRRVAESVTEWKQLNEENIHRILVTNKGYTVDSFRVSITIERRQGQTYDGKFEDKASSLDIMLSRIFARDSLSLSVSVVPFGVCEPIDSPHYKLGIVEIK